MNEKEIIADLKKTIEYAQKCCREDAYINQETLFAVLNLLEKKDKIIDEMAEYIVYLIEYNNPEEIRAVEDIKQYYERKVENGN